MNRLKIQTFPRVNGKCKIHHISEDVEGISDELYATQFDFQLAMNYLQGEDLIYGDVVYFEKQSDCYHNSLGFFDGEKFVELGSSSEVGSIPEQFHVIENGTPIKYWSRCLASSIVHFDHTLVQEECIKNVKYGYLKDDIFAIYTTFMYTSGNDTKEYKILWDYHYEDIENDSTYEIGDCALAVVMLRKFTDYLSSKEPLWFSYTSEYPFEDKNFLYVSI